MNCLGIDLSTRAIDLVLVDENTDTASHTRIELEGHNGYSRVRNIRSKMPPPSWYVDNGVYLIGLERPFARSRNDVVRLAQGAVLACLPDHLEVWEITPTTWKHHLGVKQADKPTAWSFVNCDDRIHTWPQDALDALGVAIYTRDTNAAGIAATLAHGPP